MRINNTYLHSYNDETDALLEAMPKILENKAALLYNLLSKILIYNPQKRVSAREMLSHPWFYIDGQTITREWRTNSEGLE
jgi:serine/threonine-protein kinase SRPK3